MGASTTVHGVEITLVPAFSNTAERRA
jgi:hypothetical protein